MDLSRGKRLMALLFAALTLVLVAGCGGDDDSSSGSGDSNETTAATPPAPKVPKASIAYGEVAAVDEITNRNVDQIKWVADYLGWDLKFTDAQGDVAALNTGLVTSINQGVDAVIVGSTDGQLIAPALEAAQKKGIPTIVIGGAISESDLYDAHYTEDERLMSTLLTEKMAEDLGDEGDIFALEISQLSSGTIRKEARDKILADTNIEVVADQEGDLADPVQGTEKLVSDILTANPEVDAGWLVYDYMLPPTLQAISQANLSEEPGLYTWFAGPENAALLRENEDVKALIENNFDHTALIAMDQVLANVADGAEVNPNAITDCPLKYEVVTKENAPEPETRIWELEDNREPFLAKWTKSEFGQGADCGEGPAE